MKVLVVERVKQERRALVEALAMIDEIAVCGAVGDLRSVERVFEEAPPDVVVTGTELEDGRGIDLISCAARLARTPQIVVVAEAPTREEWRAHLDAGAARVVERDEQLSELTDVVLSLARNARPADVAESAEHADPVLLVGRLAGGVVHDLNNYLMALQFALEELQETPNDPELWGRTQVALDLASRLTRSLLGYVRGAPQPPKAVELGALVRDLLSAVGRPLRQRATLTLDVADGLPAVRGTASELEQLVLNLVLNAIDASPTGGEVMIRIHSVRGEAVTLEVTDHGGGLDDAALGRAAVLSPSTKPGRIGGLGLGIVRAVAERHHAQIRIVRPPTGGTTVTVVFPRA